MFRKADLSRFFFGNPLFFPNIRSGYDILVLILFRNLFEVPNLHLYPWISASIFRWFYEPSTRASLGPGLWHEIHATLKAVRPRCPFVSRHLPKPLFVLESMAVGFLWSMKLGFLTKNITYSIHQDISVPGCPGIYISFYKYLGIVSRLCMLCH